VSHEVLTRAAVLTQRLSSATDAAAAVVAQSMVRSWLARRRLTEAVFAAIAAQRS
jgi:hypothetical protein